MNRPDPVFEAASPELDDLVPARDIAFTTARDLGMLIKLVIQRTIKSGLLGGKQYEISARVEGHTDIAALFKGLPDELVVSYRSAFSNKLVAIKRSSLIKGVSLSAASLNEMVEMEDRLKAGAEQLKRMIDILEDRMAEIILANGA